jgi:hypothetical protein
MKKPEKKNIPTIEEVCPQLKKVKTATEVMLYKDEYKRYILPMVVHNQAIDEYERFLPSEDEIIEIMIRNRTHTFEDWNVIKIFAESISKRIRGVTLERMKYKPEYYDIWKKEDKMKRGFCPIMTRDFKGLFVECKPECAWWIGERKGKIRQKQNCCAIKLSGL